MGKICRFLGCVPLFAFGVLPAHAKAPKAVSSKQFDAAASAALKEKKARGVELNIHGVAVVAFAPGDSIEGWVSEMAVVGQFTQAPNGDAGNNLLGIAYAKAAEAANELQDS